jgi:peptide subunit release factor 1 (eRF1)
VAALAEAAAGNRGAVVGPEPTFEAIAAGRVGELLVDVDLSLPGATCPACGRPSLEPGACPTCGGELQPVPDVVEAAVALAVRQGARVETVNADAELADLGGIGAFLRF